MITIDSVHPVRQDRPGPRKRTFSDQLHRKAWPAFLAVPWIRRSNVLMFTLLMLLLDYATGATIRFPAFYVIPILLMAWYEGFWAGTLCGTFIVVSRLIMEAYLWTSVPWPLRDSLLNSATAISMIALFCVFTSLAGRLSREVRVLWGLLPLCMYCHKIRDAQNIWCKLETYLEDHTQATFTHGICPSCLKTHTT